MKNKDLNEGYLTTQEFSELVGISVSTLRYYDRVGVFRPAVCGAGRNSKRRYYSPMQVTTVKLIRVLTEIGVPLGTIRELAQSRTPEKLLRLLHKHEAIVADEARFLLETRSVIGTLTELLYEGISVTETELRVSEMPARMIILGGVNDFSGEAGFVREYARFCDMAHDPKLNASYSIGGYFESMEAFISAPSQPTRFYSLDPKGHERKESGLYLIGYTRGYYGQTNGLPERMAAYAKKNGLVFTGPVYNIYLFDEVSVVSPDDYLLEISASVTETRRTPSRRPRRHL